jgi:tetratricopeptide (TPR) repeat protein
MSHLILAIILLLVAGCANPVNRRTAENYYQAGEFATSRGDLVQAREMFSRALINARLGGMGPVGEAQALMKLGQVQGNLCDYASAEKSLLEARDLLAKNLPSSPMPSLPARIELGQLFYDIGQYEKAAGYFADAFAVGGSSLRDRDPATYAAVGKDYADALSRIGQTEQSKQLAGELSSIDAGSGQGKLGKTDEYVRYPKSCK